MSLLGTDACESVAPPVALSSTTTAFSVVLGVATTVGNSLVLLAVGLDPNKELRSPFNCLLVNLALADLLVGVVVNPQSVLSHYREAVGKIPPGKGLVTARNVSFFISCTASLLGLAAMTLDRFAAITYPLKYRASMSNYRAVQICVAIWLVAVTFNSVYFVVGYNIHRFIFANAAVVTTFAVILIAYVKILKSFRVQMRCLDRMHESNLENHAKRLAMTAERKVTSALMVVLLLFIACYFPSCVFIYIINLCVPCGCVFTHWIRDLQFLLVLLNSALNPVVYGYQLKSFRRAFYRLMHCQRRLRSTSRVTDSTRRGDGE